MHPVHRRRRVILCSSTMRAYNTNNLYIKLRIMKMKAFILISLIIVSQGINAQRIDKTINSSWRFQKGDGDAAMSSLKIEDWDGFNLPHTWNAVEAFDDIRGYYRGVGWYARNLQVPKEWEDKSVYIKFENANQEVKVSLNGNLAGEHVGEYRRGARKK